MFEGAQYLRESDTFGAKSLLELDLFQSLTLVGAHSLTTYVYFLWSPILDVAQSLS